MTSAAPASPPLASEPSSGLTATATSATALELRVTVTDPEVVSELSKQPAGPERERYALAALRLGVLALRSASGQVDGAALREAGQHLLADVRQLLTERGATLTGTLATELGRYFDPKTGLVSQRLDGLVRDGGDLERLLRQHLAPEESVVARTLAAHVGESSPIFKLLSPTDASGLRSQVEQAIRAALEEQQKRIVGEFSLDNKDSALSRLVREVSERQAQLQHDVKGQVDTVVQEFSLDQPTSALSRLVRSVETAQQAITREFSADNEASALSRLSQLLKSSTEQLGANLTLDQEGSALSRLKRELQAAVGDLDRRNQQFQADVRETLATLQARRQEADRSTRHGESFEAELGRWLTAEAQRLGDVHEQVGATTGTIKNCKKGDHVTTLGADSAAPGVRIVWEAKERQGVDVAAALEELEEARKNRSAQVGVFVYSRKSAPEGLQPFTRQGRHLVVSWDVDEPATDVLLHAAYSVARALAIREQADDQQSQEAAREIEEATRAIEKQAGYLEEMKGWAETIKSNGDKIAERTRRMAEALRKEVARLDQQLAALRQAGA